MLRDIYDLRRRGVIAFMAMSVAVVAGFILYSDSLVKDLSEQERERMQIWADATRQIVGVSENTDENQALDFDFLLSIIERNRTIPVLLTDDAGNILMQRNFSLPEPLDSTQMFTLSETNEAFLKKKLEHLRHTPNVIHIDMGPDAGSQHLYYEDSNVLRSLGNYPYVQLAVLLAFVLIVYYAVSSSKRAEQNKVWVGLSKETAHQLGTPISSLMAWMELLKEQGVDPDITDEMNKDVHRLSTIASRFSKIGSKPSLEKADLCEVVNGSVAYMTTRISNRIKLDIKTPSIPLETSLCIPLIEWVMENLIKNAVDAMDSGKGSIHVELSAEKNKAVVRVTDTGRGIPRKDQKAVFRPGFTTKKRGWGLGLTLTRRIVERYHGGLIYVSRSEVGVGTTFTLEFPLETQAGKPA